MMQNQTGRERERRKRGLVGINYCGGKKPGLGLPKEERKQNGDTLEERRRERNQQATHRAPRRSSGCASESQAQATRAAALGSAARRGRLAGARLR